ncbi:MAG TPA: MotA/TolQ/ExbB proton channel family protein [Verrucomicrobiae bacterium]
MIPFHATPMLATSALRFAIEKATPEGKTTMSFLLLLSLFSWTIIITKARQLMIARKASKRFMAAYASTRDPLDIKRKGEEFEGAPAYELYIRGADELDYHLKNNPITIKTVKPLNNDPALAGMTDHFSRSVTTRITAQSFEAIKVVMEEAAGGEAMGLEKGMIVLSTAVAGGPFIGLLGTVWGVMETFAGIASAGGASITAMAPGVAGALICTVIGLLVAIPAMFSYNFMVTTIRSITSELDLFGARYANQIEHSYVDNRTLSEEIKEANELLATRLTNAISTQRQPVSQAPEFANIR